MASSTIEISAWLGQLAGKRPQNPDIQLVTPLKKSPRGGSGTFLSLANDGKKYWVKPMNSPQGNRVCTTEQLVGRVGNLIGVPVCEVEIIFIPRDLVGWEFKNGHVLQEGFAHGSLALPGAVEEIRKLEYRESDDNSVRHAGYFALYDWCWGGDRQGLLDLSDDRKFYSHDHGWFLPPTGANWSIDELKAQVDVPHELTDNHAGLDFVAALEFADRIEAVSAEQILEIIAAIPDSWPVSDEELETVGYFLDRRRANVAARLRYRFGGIK